MRELRLSPGTELTLEGESFVVEESIGKGGFGCIYRVHSKDQEASDSQPSHESRQRSGVGPGCLGAALFQSCLATEASIKPRKLWRN